VRIPGNVRWASVLAVIVAAGTIATLAAQAADSKPAATVNGETITEAQVLEATGPAASGSDARARLEAMHRALDSIVETKLIAAEAAKLGTTPQQIVEAEIESNVAIPSDDQVEQAYERNKANIAIPREQALPRIRQQLVENSRRAYRDLLLRRLKKQYGFQSFLEPLRTDVATAGRPARGPAAAPVTIVEFADFECPFCGALFPSMAAIEKAYPETVRVVYRHFPLNSVHPFAQKAAEAAVCAAEQDRFWEMHDSLFGAQNDLTVGSLKRRAKDLQLDTAAFDSCLDSGKGAAQVKQDVADGVKAGVSGTPTLFVNGRILLGNQPAELRALIQDELQRAARK
jgi:predicted DsbA family dithiol-disulfide isomerase